MKMSQPLVATAFLVLGAVSTQADEPGPDVVVRATHARRHVIVRKAVSVSRAERDGAVLFSGKVLGREYAYPRYSPGLLPTTTAVAYGYAYAPDYGFAYRLVPPVPAGATCVADPQLVYNSSGVFVGYGTGLRCY